MGKSLPETIDRARLTANLRRLIQRLGTGWVLVLTMFFYARFLHEAGHMATLFTAKV